jgi:hypothetical protein
MVAGIGGHAGIGDLSGGAWPDVKTRRGGSDSFRRACPRAGGGIRLWAVFKGVRPMTPLRRTSQVHATWLGCGTGGGYVRSVYTPEPPLLFSCGRSHAWELALGYVPFATTNPTNPMNIRAFRVISGGNTSSR